MGLMSAEMLAECRKKARSLFPLLKITYPTGVLRYASRPVTVLGQGLHQGKAQAWGTLTRTISDREGNLQTPETTVSIIDRDKQFVHIIEGTSGGSARGSLAEIFLASNNVSPAKWFTMFKGMLSIWRMSKPDVWDLHMQYADRRLRTQIPNAPFTQSDWPNADPTIWGKFAPLVYGLHDSTGSTNTGMIPGYLVDKSTPTTPHYAFAQGWLGSFDRAFAGGSFQSASNYVVEHPVKGGRLWTTIKFTTSAPSATTPVTADVHGYESVGNGTGAMLQAAEQLQHLLETFVFRDFQSPTGLWPAFGTYTSAAAFTKAKHWSTELGIKTSRWYGGDTTITGLQAIAEFLRSTQQLFGFWTNDGLIAVLPFDVRDPVTYHDDPQWIRAGRGDTLGDNFRPDYDRDSLVDRIHVRYAMASAQGQYQKALDLDALPLNENIAATLELPWSQSA